MNKLFALLLMGIGMPAFATATDRAGAHSSATMDQESTVATAENTTASPTLVSAYLVAAGNATTMVVGGTLQFTAYGTYSDGTVSAIPSVEGAETIAWNTSNHAVARISTLGHATAMSTGTVNIEAMIGTVEASPWTLTVVAAVQPLSPDITVISPVNGPTVILPAWVRAHNAGCDGLEPISFGYTIDNNSALVLGVTGYDINTTDQTMRAGTHTIHFKSWNVKGMCPVVDATFTGAEAAEHTIPTNAIATRNLVGASNWEWNHDPGTPGESRGSSLYPVTSQALDGAARELYFTYSNNGGEIYHLSFARDTTATHFVYDTYIYLVNPSQIQNIEMDMNQVMSDGRTVIFGTQCATGSGTFEFTKIVNGGTHWYPSNIPCHPKAWTANTWHHVQIASHRDSDGVVTYDWVNLNGTYTDFKNASGSSAENLGWPSGDLLLNFQLDGAGAGDEPITAYVDKLTIYRW
jgi:Bacterial Ig-like domain (group 2)